MEPSLELLRGVLERAEGVDYAEVRYHARRLSEVRITRGQLEEASTTHYDGVGVRVLCEGAWGFSSTSQTTPSALHTSLKQATTIAQTSSKGRRRRVGRLAEAELAEGRFEVPVQDPFTNHSSEEKMKLVKETEEEARRLSDRVRSASCTYREILDHKIILSTDGATAELLDSKGEFRVTAVAVKSGDMVSATETVGVTGGWGDLFGKKPPEEMVRMAVDIAVKLLEARQPKGERATVILDPGMVGLIAHEAIGHNVEADFILSGSYFKGKLGERVAAESISLFDSGPSELQAGAAGTVLVDDEGVVAKNTLLIDHGVLVSYLTDRETAALFNMEPSGNARAFEYSDEPLIRMRNTYIQPGDYDVEEMIREVDHGYLLKGPRGGQADANAEFMFGAQEAYLIEKGELKRLLRGVSISGNASEVLKSVDAVGRDFSYDIGAGYCGKWQRMKVDGGGPHIRCRAIIGGIQ